jgi:succinylglutamic semialdehyde dehydrogenase
MKYKMKGNYFDGQFVESLLDGPNSVDSFIKRKCPADTSLLLWSCPVDYTHIDAVIDSAQTGFHNWRKKSLNERANYLKKYQECCLARKEEIAEAIALESGKPYWEALTEANAVIGKIDVTINESMPRIENKTYNKILAETTGHLFYKPLGPCFIIGPFNFPCHLANGQITSALIAGNSIIFKPSDKTCYSGQILIECFHAAGFPKGVVNLVQGDGEVARRLLKSKIIKGVYFTGSKDVGLDILKTTHTDLSKMVQLELGGKNGCIIHSDAPLEHTYPELLRSSFMTTGQRCTSTAIVAIQDKLLDEFIDKFHSYAKKIIIDHPIDFEEEPFMGPLVDKNSFDKYLLFMGMAKRENIEEIMRGKHLQRKYQGHYVTPSIHFAKEYNQDSHFLTSEIFGPNVTFIPYKEIEEAIEIVNHSEYGLAASLFASDPKLYELCVRDLDVGLVNFNKSTVGASSKLPFGGVKNSGNYRPAAVSTVDACVYQMAGLNLLKPNDTIESVKGLKL